MEVEKVMQSFFDDFPFALLNINTSNTDPRPFSKLEFDDIVDNEIDGLVTVEINCPLSQFGLFVRLLEDRPITHNQVDLSEYRNNNTPLLLTGCGYLSVLEDNDYLHYKDTIFKVNDANRLRTWSLFYGIVSPIKVQSGNVLSDHHSLLYDELGAEKIPSIFRLVVAHVLPKSFFQELSKERKKQTNNQPTAAYTLLVHRALHVLRLVWTRKSILEPGQTLKLSLFEDDDEDDNRDTEAIDDKCSTESLQSLRSSLWNLIGSDDSGNLNDLHVLDAAFSDQHFSAVWDVVNNNREDVFIALQYQLALMLSPDHSDEFPRRLDSRITALVNSGKLPSMPPCPDELGITFYVHESDSTITGGFLFMLLTLFGVETFKTSLSNLFTEENKEHHQSIVSILVNCLSQYVKIARLAFSSWTYEEAIEHYSGYKECTDLLKKNRHKPALLSADQLPQLEQFKDIQEDILILPASHSPARSAPWKSAEQTALDNTKKLIKELIKLDNPTTMTPAQQAHQFTFFHMRLMERLGAPSIYSAKDRNRQNLVAFQNEIEVGLLEVGKSLNRFNQNMERLCQTLLKHAEDINKDLGKAPNGDGIMDNIRARFTNGLKYNMNIGSNKTDTYGRLEYDFQVEEWQDNREEDGFYRYLKPTERDKNPGDIKKYAIEQVKSISSGAMKSMASNHLKRVYATTIKMVKFLYGKANNASTFATKKQIRVLLPPSVSGQKSDDDKKDDMQDSPIDLVNPDDDFVIDDDDEGEISDDKYAEKIRTSKWGAVCVDIFDSVDHLNDFPKMLHLLLRMQNCIEAFDLQSSFSINRMFPEFSPLENRQLNMTRHFIGENHAIITGILNNSAPGRELHEWAMKVLESDQIKTPEQGQLYTNILANTIGLDMAAKQPKFEKLFGKQTRGAFSYIMKHDAHGLHCTRKIGNLSTFKTFSEVSDAWEDGNNRQKGMIRGALKESNSCPYPFHLGLVFNIGAMLKYDEKHSTKATASRWDGVVCFSSSEARARVWRQRSPKLSQTAYCAETKGVDTDALWRNRPERLLLWKLSKRYDLYTSQLNGKSRTNDNKVVVARQIVAECKQLSSTPKKHLEELDPTDDDWTSTVDKFETRFSTWTKLAVGNGHAGHGSAGKAYFAGNAKPLLDPLLCDEQFNTAFNSWIDADNSDPSSWIADFPDPPEQWETQRVFVSKLFREDMATFARDPGLYEAPVEIQFREHPGVQFNTNIQAIEVHFADAIPLTWQHLVDKDVKEKHNMNDHAELRTKTREEILDKEQPEKTKSKFIDRRESRQADYDRILAKRKQNQEGILSLGTEKRNLNRRLKEVERHNASLFSGPRKDKLVGKRYEILKGHDLASDLASLPLNQLKTRLDEDTFVEVAQVEVHSLIVSGNCDGFKTYGGLTQLIESCNTCFSVLEHQSTKRCFCGSVSGFHWSSFTPGIGRPRRSKHCRFCGLIVDRDLSAACIQFFEFVGKITSTLFLSHSLLTCERYSNVLARLKGKECDTSIWEDELVIRKREREQKSSGDGDPLDDEDEEDDRIDVGQGSGNGGDDGIRVRRGGVDGSVLKPRRTRPKNKKHKKEQKTMDKMVISDEAPSTDKTMVVENQSSNSTMEVENHLSNSTIDSDV